LDNEPLERRVLNRPGLGTYFALFQNAMLRRFYLKQFLILSTLIISLVASAAQSNHLVAGGAAEINDPFLGEIHIQVTQSTEPEETADQQIANFINQAPKNSTIILGVDAISTLARLGTQIKKFKGQLHFVALGALEKTLIAKELVIKNAPRFWYKKPDLKKMTFVTVYTAFGVFGIISNTNVAVQDKHTIAFIQSVYALITKTFDRTLNIVNGRIANNGMSTFNLQKKFEIKNQPETAVKLRTLLTIAAGGFTSGLVTTVMKSASSASQLPSAWDGHFASSVMLTTMAGMISGSYIGLYKEKLKIQVETTGYRPISEDQMETFDQVRTILLMAVNSHFMSYTSHPFHFDSGAEVTSVVFYIISGITGLSLYYWGDSIMEFKRSPTKKQDMIDLAKRVSKSLKETITQLTTRPDLYQFVPREGGRLSCGGAFSDAGD
jgi:hypothetical protein